MLNQIRWGIIGCGSVCEKKSGPALNLVDGSCVAAIMCRNEHKASDFARRHHVPKWFTDGQELIQAEDVNAIYIATPPNSHAAYAIQAMQAGKPVYVEKPMALSFEECQQMLTVSQETGVPLYVAYYFPSLPYFMKIKELLQEDVIGRITAVSLVQIIQPSQEVLQTEKNWRLEPSISGGGYFFDIGCHQIQLLDSLFGPIVQTSGEYANRAGMYKPEDTLVASFRFESGVLASCCWCYVGDKHNNVDHIEIFGTEGRMVFSTSTLKPIELYHHEQKETWRFEKPKPSCIAMIDHVVKSLLEIHAFPSNAVSAARTAWAMDKILGKI